MLFKKLIFGMSPGGGTLKVCQNICFLNIYIFEKTSTFAWAVQKINFVDHFVGVPSPNYVK